MNAFAEKLKEQKVFVRAVKTGGIAFHSSAMQAVAPEFRRRLEQVCVWIAECVTFVCGGGGLLWLGFLCLLFVSPYAVLLQLQVFACAY